MEGVSIAHTGVVDLGVIFGLTLQYIAFQDHVFQDLCHGIGLAVLVVNKVDEATLLHAYATKSFKTLSLKDYSQWLMR